MDTQTKRYLDTIDLGRISYGDALERQLEYVESLKADPTGHDKLLLLEHAPAVITLGRRGSENDFLVSRDEILRRGIEIFESSRGGEVTYHGPGQLVGYAIRLLDNKTSTVRGHVHDLEQTIIELLGDFGIAAGRKKGFTGVWIGEEKIAAIGVAVHRWITYHGFALNVTTDMDAFKLFVPCGIRDKGVTSMKKLISQDVNVEQIKILIDKKFRKVFGY